MTEKEKQQEERDKLELRKVKALEKIGNSLDALVIWFEEIDKTEWSERIQHYLYEFHSMRKVDFDEIHEVDKK
jgi:hypothetical protein